jgi:hypothetical protein
MSSVVSDEIVVALAARSGYENVNKDAISYLSLHLEARLRDLVQVWKPMSVQHFELVKRPILCSRWLI